MYDKLMEIIDTVLLYFIIYIIGITVAIQCEYPMTPCFFVFDCVVFFLFSNYILGCTFEIIPEKYRCLIDDGEFELRFWDVFLTILYILALIALYPYRDELLPIIFFLD